MSLSLKPLNEQVIVIMSVAQANRQQYDEAPRNPEGALYSPSEDGQTHGGGGIEKKQLLPTQNGPR